VVLVVGARLFGHASTSTCACNTKSAWVPKKESLLDVIAISELFVFFIRGTNTLISGVFPLLEMQMTTSSCWSEDEQWHFALS